MYHALKIDIRKNHPLWGYFDDLAHKSCNLYNASLFRIRQVLTGIRKETPTDNEQTVLDEISKYLPQMNLARKPDKLFRFPTVKTSLLSYNFLEALLRKSGNPDYLALPAHTSQDIVRRTCSDVRNFFLALREWKKHPEKFTGKPRITRYKQKGGIYNIIFSNQECVIKDDLLKFPGTIEKLQLCEIPSNSRLKQVEVIPHHGIFTVHLTLENDVVIPDPVSEKPARICAIDFGVDNIADMANNISKPGWLFKGGIIKATNQWANKRLAQIASGRSVGKTEPVKESCRSIDNLFRKRTGFFSTVFHTLARKVINICLDWKIDTLVLGVNHGWKQNVEIGKVNNQNFVGIPYDSLQFMLKYLGEKCGIRVVEQEESYTSKASFPDRDYIPVYNPDKPVKHQFSGHRENFSGSF